MASLPVAERRKLLKTLSTDQAAALLWDWRFWARPKQLPPAGDWSTWMLRAGRGFGKTRSGAGWVHARAMKEARWIALVARTPADARDYMIEGPGGLERNTAPHERPNYEPSKRRLTWPNGSWATIYSDDEPDQVRGFSGDTAWLDELGKFKHPKAVWDNLAFGMRECSADRPRRLITTTPRPLEILEQIEALPGTITVIGSSYENRANLDPTWFAEEIAAYEGTSWGRQEIHAEILTASEGALWDYDTLERNRVMRPPDMARIVVSVDPAATSTEQSDETGIVAAGLGVDKHGYVLSDYSGRYKPEAWARRAIVAYDDLEADRIVAEVNNGGEMVGFTVSAVAREMHRNGERSSSEVAFKAIHASRGKVPRAEPISALDEAGRVHHVGLFDRMEKQLCTWEPMSGMRSPDRLDARVWALTDLMLKKEAGGPRIW